MFRSFTILLVISLAVTSSGSPKLPSEIITQNREGKILTIHKDESLKDKNHERAALFSKPRIFPFLDQLFNPGPPIIQPSHRPISQGGAAYSPFYTPGYHHNEKPACAHNEMYCLYDKGYPMDKVNSIVNRYYDDVRQIYSTLHRVPTADIVYYDNRTNSYREGGHFVCESDVHYIRPGWARSVQGEWLCIVNTDHFPQTVRVEECKYANRRCEYLPPCYKSNCVQRFSYQRLLAVDPIRPTGKPFIEVFEIPSACSCFVENFVYYK